MCSVVVNTLTNIEEFFYNSLKRISLVNILVHSLSNISEMLNEVQIRMRNTERKPFR